MDEANFARPYRRRVRHAACGTVTVLSRYIAEQLAMDPGSVPELRCSACHEHLTASSFRWIGDQGADEETVGIGGPEPTGLGWPG